MSSSNRRAEPCDAVVYRDDRAIGPLRLPSKNAASFIEQFNRLYGDSGMALEHNRINQSDDTEEGQTSAYSSNS